LHLPLLPVPSERLGEGEESAKLGSRRGGGEKEYEKKSK